MEDIVFCDLSVAGIPITLFVTTSHSVHLHTKGRDFQGHGYQDPGLPGGHRRDRLPQMSGTKVQHYYESMMPLWRKQH